MPSHNTPALAEEEQNCHQRTALLIGKAGLSALEGAHILLAGLGGVGGHCLESLARAGIGKLTLIDFDCVDKTNLNRQLLATQSTIGQQKADLARDRVAQINPTIAVNTYPIQLLPENIADILNQCSPLTAVVDCIDQFEPKCDLLIQAHGLGIPVFSSMGAGNRLNPTQVRLGDISQTTHCGLAKKVRLRLKEAHVTSGITTVFSTEPTQRQFNQTSTIGSISYMPALFGCSLAGAVISAILKGNDLES